MAITPERLAQLRKELFGRLYRLKPADENQNFAAKFREAQKEIDRLRRLEAAVGDDGLRTNVALTAALKGMEPLDVAELYRAALLAAMKGETKP